MNKRIWIYLLLLALFIPTNVDGQRWKLRRYEVGIGGGSTHSFMDIGSPKDALRSFQLIDSRFNFSTHAGFKILSSVTVRLDLNYLMLGGIDPEIRDRNLTFTANTFEPLVRVDYNIVGSGARSFGSTALFNRRGMINNFGESYVYLFAGGGAIMSRSIVRDGNGDEVVGNPSYYNNINWGIVIPAGLGYKRSMNAYVDLAIEVGGRFSFSDKIDGYQHSTASDYKDKYITTTFKAVYKIRNDRRGLPIFSRYGRR